MLGVNTLQRLTGGAAPRFQSGHSDLPDFGAYESQLETVHGLCLMGKQFSHFLNLLNAPDPIQRVQPTASLLESGKPVEIRLADKRIYTVQVERGYDPMLNAYTEVFSFVRKPDMPDWTRKLPRFFRDMLDHLYKDELYLKEVAAMPNNQVWLTTVHGFHQASFHNASAEAPLQYTQLLESAREFFYGLEVRVDKMIAKQNPA